MLQTVHQKKAAPRASSIYCRWVRENHGEGSRLLAVWIDSEMRCFDREFAEHPKTEATPQGALNDPGGVMNPAGVVHAIKN
jgi:hypothetical protein